MLPGLVLGPGPLTGLPPSAAVPQFLFAASSSKVLPALVDTSPLLKTIATVEYEELVRTKQLAEQNVKYISSLEQQVSILSHELHECPMREQSVIARVKTEYITEIENMKRQYTQTYETM